MYKFISGPISGFIKIPICQIFNKSACGYFFVKD